ncbi:unnamed protein product [Knipowitschia caucasica]
MAQAVHPHSDMVKARHCDGVNVIFDQMSPASSRSKSRSRSASSSSSGCSSASRGRSAKRDYCRSSSSSRSKSRSSRSRSHPRCHRPSSRCRCRDHRRRRARCISPSPKRHYRTHSRSFSRSPSVDRRRHYHSRSRSRYSHSRVSRCRSPFSRSPLRSFRARSRSRSSERSLALSSEAKQQLLEVARQNAMKILGVQRLELPESVKPTLMSQFHDSTGAERRVRRDSENSTSQISEEQHDSLPTLSPKRGMISFSVNNSIAKPTIRMQSSVKVTSLVDSVESKKPYGHWIPVRSVRH